VDCGSDIDTPPSRDIFMRGFSIATILMCERGVNGQYVQNTFVKESHKPTNAGCLPLVCAIHTFVASSDSPYKSVRGEVVPFPRSRTHDRP